MRISAGLAVLFAAACVVAGCSSTSDRDGVGARITGVPPEALAAVLANASDAHALRLNHAELDLLWGVTGGQEQGCGGGKIAGGEVGGHGSFSSLGHSQVSVSAAWDIGHLLPGPHHFSPVGPASGPVAPVLGHGQYPYAFHFDPASGGCGVGPTATGKLTLVAANGDEVFGEIVGGEAFKLHYIIDGDGVETFAIIDVTGGTGRFDHATGSFVVHDVAQLRPTGKFGLNLVEVLPGGTLNR
jgi:hypothetical protein